MLSSLMRQANVVVNKCHKCISVHMFPPTVISHYAFDECDSTATTRGLSALIAV